MCYLNFIDQLGKRNPIKMVLPSNADISGYDTIVYEVYFGEVKDAERSGFVAMENNMAMFIEYAEEIMKKDLVTVTDETLVSNAITAYNGIKGNYADFGIEKTTWDEMVTAATEANTRIRELKFAHASYKVKQLQAQIDSLAGEYDKSKVPTMQDIQAKLKNFKPAEREVLDLTELNKFVEEYEKHQKDNPDPKPDDPDKPDPKPDDGKGDNGNNCGNCKSAVTADASAALIAIVTLGGVAIIVKRKNGIG